MNKTENKTKVSHDLKVIHEVLEKSGMAYERDPSWFENVLVKKDDGEIESYLFQLNGDGLLNCCAVLRKEASEANMTALLDLLNRINNGLQYGRFSVHPDSGGISIMVYVSYEPGHLKPKQVLEALVDVKSLVSVYGSAVHGVLAGERTVKEVMCEIDQKLSANCVPIEY